MNGGLVAKMVPKPWLEPELNGFWVDARRSVIAKPSVVTSWPSKLRSPPAFVASLIMHVDCS